MNLAKYKEKRNFKKTAEPTGGKAASDDLIFAVQMHAASSLHYDFRLEMDGVLKSWAVPKGPSLTPSVKRLAMTEEAPPYDYKDFEGTLQHRFPESFSPMLATLTEPSSQKGWLYEIKWDGYRALAMMNKKAVNLLSRNKKSFNLKYPSVYAAVQEWGIDAIVDGEIVALNKAGKPEFNVLQNWQSADNTPIIYYVFDLLWLNGHDLTGLPLEQRRDLLRECVPEGHEIIRFSENFNTSATKLLKLVSRMGLEGIIAKRVGSLYFPGERTKDWVKMKIQQRQEVVIGGYTRLHGSSKPFSALLIGVYEDGQFHYAGKIGTGFSQEAQRDMLKKFKPFIREKNPFDVLPKVSKPAHFRAHPKGVTVTFLEPTMVCEVAYTEITSEGILRHASFAGLRDDKPANEVVQEAHH